MTNITNYEFYKKTKQWLLKTWCKKWLLLPIIIFLILYLIFSTKLNSFFDAYFSMQNRFNELQSLAIAVCGAMIPVATIATSFIMFAMQVNIDRMPYWLFKIFSSDRKLLSYVISAFIFAISIGIFPIVVKPSWVGLIMSGVISSLILVIMFLLFAYNRALKLISPTEQLLILVEQTKKDLNDAVSKAAENYKGQDEADTKADMRSSAPESAKFIYFHRNPQWANNARQTIQGAFSIAKYHARQGDYDSAKAALNTVIDVNAAYITAKGKTFFPDHPFMDSSLSHDSLIQETLEHLKKYVKIALSDRNEQQIILAFNANTKLISEYLKIDYATDCPISPHHAVLAATYLTNAIESVIPHKMTDVIMTGVRLLGDASLCFIKHGHVNCIEILLEDISNVSCQNIIDPKTRPITYTGVDQLARITIQVLKSESENVQSTLNKIRDNVIAIAIIALERESGPFSNASNHTLSSDTLKPYYSVTSDAALIDRLTELANTLLTAEADDKNSKRVVRHIAQWGKDPYEKQKELLLLAIQKNSSFTFDIIHWLSQVTMIFISISTAPCCEYHPQKELGQLTRLWINIFSSIPDNEKAIKLVETKGFLTDQIFEVAYHAVKLNAWKVSTNIKELLLSWAFKSGKYQIGREILAKAFCGLAYLNIIEKLNDAALLTFVEEEFNKKGSVVSKKDRQAIAKSLKNKMTDIQQGSHSSSKIYNAIKTVDAGKKEKLGALLSSVSDILSTEKSDVKNNLNLQAAIDTLAT